MLEDRGALIRNWLHIHYPHPQPFSRHQEKGVWFYDTCDSRALAHLAGSKVYFRMLTKPTFRMKQMTSLTKAHPEQPLQRTRKDWEQNLIVHFTSRIA